MTAPSAANQAPPIEAPHGRSLAARVCGVALLLFLVAGLASTLVAVATDRLDLAPHGLGRQAFLDGASMRDMAAALADAPMAKGGARLERQASWLAVEDLGPQVRQGCDGWLFLAEELAPQADAERHLQARARAVIDIQAALRKRGIELLVAVVPDKSRVESAELCQLRRAPSLAGRLAEWTTRLKAAGVPTVDTTPALRALQDQGRVAFLRTDTHWTENGAQAAAGAVADAARSLGVEMVPHQDYDIQRGPPVRRPGDLVRLAGLDSLPPSWQPAPEDAAESRFVARETEGAAAPAEADLFGDAELPRVALVGTSFSRNSHFADFLAAALQTPVPDFAKDGGNFWGSAGAYFASEAFRKTPPRLIIWEIPERTLQLPTTGEHWNVP